MTPGEKFLKTVNNIPILACREHKVAIWKKAQEEFEREWNENAQKVADHKKELKKRLL